jgi:hypothetical protein
MLGPAGGDMKTPLVAREDLGDVLYDDFLPSELALAVRSKAELDSVVDFALRDEPVGSLAFRLLPSLADRAASMLKKSDKMLGTASLRTADLGSRRRRSELPLCTLVIEALV